MVVSFNGSIYLELIRWKYSRNAGRRSPGLRQKSHIIIFDLWPIGLRQTHTILIVFGSNITVFEYVILILPSINILRNNFKSNTLIVFRQQKCEFCRCKHACACNCTFWMNFSCVVHIQNNILYKFWAKWMYR